MRDNDIIKALECHTGNKFKRCQVCPYTIYGCWCLDHLHPDLLNLIKRQKAEIERSEKELMQCKLEKEMMYQTVEEIKSEAIKEFAERLKIKVEYGEFYDATDDYIMTVEHIDDLVKEMTEVSE